MLPGFTGSSVALTAPAKTKVHENGVYHIWGNTILFLACSETPRAGRNPSCLHELPVQLHHQLSGAHCVMANKLLSHCVPILFFILAHASCIEFRVHKEAVKTFLLPTVWQNAVNIQCLLFGLNRMSFWIIIMHMVTLHYVCLQQTLESLKSISLLSTMHKILSNIVLSWLIP